MTEFSCPFGIAEKLLREKEYPSVPDRELLVDEKILLLSGIRVYLPQFSVTVHEGIFCHRENSGVLQPEYAVSAVVDRKTGELLYDEEGDFTETVFLWKNETIPLAEIKRQMCVVEGIEVREHDNTMQTARGRGNHK